MGWFMLSRGSPCLGLGQGPLLQLGLGRGLILKLGLGRRPVLELGLGLGARAHSTLAWVLARIEGECACHSGAWPMSQRP